MTENKTRIDKYLWCIRIFKTRNEAAEACKNNKVRLNGKAVKASKIIAIGEEYDIRTPNRKWHIQITGVLNQRVSYQNSLNYYIDKSPEDLTQKKQSSAFIFYTGKRKSKQGRPTKKAKRDLDNLKDDLSGF